MGGTIFGRSPNLVVGAVSAIYGVLSVFHIGGFTPTADQNGVVTIAIGAIVAVIAGNASVAIASGQAAVNRAASTVADVVTQPVTIAPAATPPPTITPNQGGKP